MNYTHHFENHPRRTTVILFAASETGAQSGKDTGANFFEKYMASQGKKVTITHHADLLKQMVKMYYKTDDDKFKIRGLYQELGTDIIRKDRPEYWVQHILGQLDFIDRLDDTSKYILIPDARFPNEIEGYRNAGYKTISVNVCRPGYDNGLTEEQRNHPSETALRGYPFDITFVNDGTLEDYEAKIIEFAKTLLANER